MNCLKMVPGVILNFYYLQFIPFNAELAFAGNILVTFHGYLKNIWKMTTEGNNHITVKIIFNI